MTWKPISSAPRGTLALFCDMNATEVRDMAFVDWIVDGKFCRDPKRKATHWKLIEWPKETDDGR